jgi:hypothetical protein
MCRKAPPLICVRYCIPKYTTSPLPYIVSVPGTDLISKQICFIHSRFHYCYPPLNIQRKGHRILSTLRMSSSSFLHSTTVQSLYFANHQSQTHPEVFFQNSSHAFRRLMFGRRSLTDKGSLVKGSTGFRFKCSIMVALS